MPILFVALGLFGVVAALFGPVKYGILPEKLETAELPAGNALVEGATFLAILIGTIAGGIAVAAAGSAQIVVGVILALAIASWSFARIIPAAGPAAPGLTITANPWMSTLALLRELKSDRRLWGGAHIISWFWLVGFVALSLLPALIKTLVGGSEGVVTMCLAVFTVGIAIGSGLAARASHGQPNLGLVPLGALLMGIFALGIAWIAAMLAPGSQPIGPAEVLASGTGLAPARLPVRPGDRRRPVHRARRSPPCSRGPRWTGARASSPPSTSSTPPTWWARAASSRCCRR